MLIDIAVGALNHLDVDIREGVSRFDVAPPFILGVEVVGRISALGDGVDGWQVGERVMPYLMGTCGECRYCKTGRESLCLTPGFISFTTSGGYAEKLACPARQLIRVPDELSDEDAAATQIAFATAWHMLFTRAKLQPGETVLINSVGSGIGSAAVQLAKLAGAFVIGNAGSDEKLERAKELGLDVGINHQTQDVVAEVMRATDGRGVEVVYEHVGGELFQHGLDSLAKDGRLVICGAHSGEVVPFDIIPFFRAQKQIIGSFVYNRDEVEKVLDLAARGLVKPLVYKTFPLEQARDAMETMERREHFGKILLSPGGGTVKRLGVDVGGTFTDLIYVDDVTGRILVHKLPTTPEDPSLGTLQGIRELVEQAGETPSALDQVFHGTTIATNIVIEHNGATVGLITTEGYRDILHIARHKKPLNFSNYQDLPWQRYPIVRRRYRLTVPERILKDGSVLVPLDEERARERVRELKEAGVEAVSVCFLFSFVNPAHEQRVAEIVREEFPEAFLSVSSEVLPQYREYERFSTVSLNAYIGPKVSRYVRRLEEELEALEVRTKLHLMTSASGVATPEGAVARPVNLLMSGPVAGVVGGIWAGRQAGYDNVITLDVGGTSADIGLAQDGQLRMKHLLDTKVGPYQAMIPMVDVDTIGAGGGSIAYVDQGGIFRVGPRSAGADPGPAAYGRGGEEPTGTDAMVNLGWLLPEAFLGGQMEVRPELARAAFEQGPAQALGMSVEEASMGAVQILTHSMVQSIEENSVRKGYDPRDFALVAEGGAGPLFAAQIALEVGTPWVLVPPHPGITSAMGLLATDMVYEYVSTAYQRLSQLDAAALQRQFEELEERARAQLEEDGIPAESMVIQRVADCRYLGQGYELRVDVESGAIDEAWGERVRASFHDIHEREYSRRFDESDIEIPNVRVRGIGRMPRLSTPEVEKGPESPEAALRYERDAWFRVRGELAQVPTRYYERSALKAGNRLDGPAIVNQYDSTTVIPPEVSAHVDGFGNIVIATGVPAERDALAQEAVA